MFVRTRQVLLFIHYLLVQCLHHYVASLGSAKYLAQARLPRTTLNRNIQNQTHKRTCCCRATRERQTPLLAPPTVGEPCQKCDGVSLRASHGA
jgi:hypothetical protein